MLWQLLLLGVSLLAGVLLARKYYQQLYDLKLRRQMASASARWHLQHQQDSPGVLIENVPVGWINLLLQALWGPVLEKHIAGLIMNLLQRVLSNLAARRAGQGVFKVLEGLTVESCGLGLAPPRLRSASARYDPGQGGGGGTLVLLVDVRFVSSGAELLLAARTRPTTFLRPLDIRLEATQVSIGGKLRLGLQFGREAPGLKALQYSFVEAPELDLVVRPLGAAGFVADLGFVVTLVRDLLAKLLTKQLTEPVRRVLDIQRMYLEKHIARAGGPGGLVLLLIRSVHLHRRRSTLAADGGPPAPPAPEAAAAAAAAVGGGTPAAVGEGEDKKQGKPGKDKAAAAAAAAAPQRRSLYCEVRYGRLILRTPITHTTAAHARFDWELSLPLVAPLPSSEGAGAAGSSSQLTTAAAAAGTAGAGAAAAAAAGGGVEDVVRVLVYDAAALGEPQLLARAKLFLSQLGLVPGAAALPLSAPLAGPGAAPGAAAVHLDIQWLTSLKRPNAASQGGAASMGGAPLSATPPPQPAAAGGGGGGGRPGEATRRSSTPAPPAATIAAAAAVAGGVGTTPSPPPPAAAAGGGSRLGHIRSKSVSALHEAVARMSPRRGDRSPDSFTALTKRHPKNASESNLSGLGSAAATAAGSVGSRGSSMTDSNSARQSPQLTQQQQQVGVSGRAAGVSPGSSSSSPSHVDASAGSGWLRSKLVGASTSQTAKASPPTGQTVDPGSTAAAAGTGQVAGSRRLAVRDWFRGRRSMPSPAMGAAVASSLSSTDVVGSTIPSSSSQTGPGLTGATPAPSPDISRPLPPAAAGEGSGEWDHGSSGGGMLRADASHTSFTALALESHSPALSGSSAEEAREGTQVGPLALTTTAAAAGLSGSIGSTGGLTGGLTAKEISSGAPGGRHSRHSSAISDLKRVTEERVTDGCVGDGGLEVDLRDAAAAAAASPAAAGYVVGVAGGLGNPLALQQQQQQQQGVGGVARGHHRTSSSTSPTPPQHISWAGVSPLVVPPGADGPVNVDQSNSPFLVRPVSGKEGSIVALLGALSREQGSMVGALTPTGPSTTAAAAGGGGGGDVVTPPPPAADGSEPYTNSYHSGSPADGAGTRPVHQQQQPQPQSLPLMLRSRGPSLAHSTNGTGDGPRGYSSMGDGSGSSAAGASAQVLLALTQQRRQLAAQAAELAALQDKHQSLLSRHAAVLKLDETLRRTALVQGALFTLHTPDKCHLVTLRLLPAHPEGPCLWLADAALAGQHKGGLDGGAGAAAASKRIRRPSLALFVKSPSSKGLQQQWGSTAAAGDGGDSSVRPRGGSTLPGGTSSAGASEGGDTSSKGGNSLLRSGSDKSSGHGSKQQQQQLFSTLVPLSHLVEVRPGTGYFPVGDAKSYRKKLASFKSNLAALVAQAVKEAGLPETASFAATAATASAESAAAAGAGSGAAAALLPPERCFTIVLRPRQPPPPPQQQQQQGGAGGGPLPPPSSSAAAGGGGDGDHYGFNLELPPGGNGRSRDEWLDALHDLLLQQQQHQEVVQRAAHGASSSSSQVDQEFLSCSDSGGEAGRKPGGTPSGAASSSTHGRQQRPTAAAAPVAASAAGGPGGGVISGAGGGGLPMQPPPRGGPATALLDL